MYNLLPNKAEFPTLDACSLFARDNLERPASGVIKEWSFSEPRFGNATLDFSKFLDRAHPFLNNWISDHHHPFPLTVSSVSQYELDHIPFIYIPKKRGNANFIVFGCAQSNSDHKNDGSRANEKMLAARSIAQDVPREKISALLLTGDNIYPDGASSAMHPWKFEQSIYRYYSTDPLSMVPLYPVNGNHDLKIDNKFIQGFKFVSSQFLGRKATIWDRAMAPVLRTYLPMEQSRNWVMPNLYYALKYDHVNLFFLDSNTLPFDSNAIKWLIDAYHKLNPPGSKKWNCAIYHHSITSAGKRCLHAPHKKTSRDFQSYAFSKIAEPFERSDSFNQTLMNGFIYLEKYNSIKMDLTLGAHDHNLAFMKHRHLHGYQVISGAAGDRDILQSIDDSCLNIDPAQNMNDWAMSTNGYVKVYFHEGICTVRFMNHLGVEIHRAEIFQPLRARESEARASSPG